jgi:hypothetical protein
MFGKKAEQPSLFIVQLNPRGQLVSGQTNRIEKIA